MEETFKPPKWVAPVLAGGIVIGPAVIAPVSEAIREATDICAMTHQVIACQPVALPLADRPDPEHVPAAPRTVTTTVVSTSSTASTSPTTTVAGEGQ